MLVYPIKGDSGSGERPQVPLDFREGAGANRVPSHLSKDCPESLFAQPQCEVLSWYGEARGSHRHRVTHEVASSIPPSARNMSAQNVASSRISSGGRPNTARDTARDSARDTAR